LCGAILQELREGPHDQYEAAESPSEYDPLILDRSLSKLPSNFGEAYRVDRACDSSGTKAEKVKTEKVARTPVLLTRNKIVVDQAGKIQGTPCKKKKSATPDNYQADCKITHFRLDLLLVRARRIHQHD
jgi:hypothetical protein